MPPKDEVALNVVLHSARCKGCGLCINACPKGAISVGDEVNKKGYRPVLVDEDACIRCGICYIVCPDYVFEIRKVA